MRPKPRYKLACRRIVDYGPLTGHDCYIFVETRARPRGEPDVAIVQVAVESFWRKP